MHTSASTQSNPGVYMNAQSARVLYLEDDEDTVEMVTFMLVSGIDVIAVSSSKEAARLAKSEPFDLYLLDGLLPTGNSFELCRELRRHDASVPVIFYSALGFPADIKQGAEAGADAYLVKPYWATLQRRYKKRSRRAKTNAAPAGTSVH